MYTELKDRFKHNDDITIADINADVMMKTPYGEQIEGFPTMLCITKNGAKLDPIENAKLKNKPRTIDAFIEWVESKTPAIYTSSNASSRKKKYRVTPYPRMHHKRSRHSAKKGGMKKNNVNKKSKKRTR